MQPEMMKSRKVRLGLLVLVGVILLFAWIDGGREPQRMIEQPVELAPAATGQAPEEARP